MNRERLTILRDHLASLPSAQFDMTVVSTKDECGTVACIAGWAGELARQAGDFDGGYFCMEDAERWLGLSHPQARDLFVGDGCRDDTKTTDAIAAIQSMLDNPADDALPVWPDKAVSA